MLHAEFLRHVYPAHVHEDWTLLLVDSGVVAYTLDGRPHRAHPGNLTVLPPGVPHDGASAERGVPFRKRVIYLDAGWLGPGATARAATSPTHERPELRRQVARLHAILRGPVEPLDVEALLDGIGEGVTAGIGGRLPEGRWPVDAPLASRLRDLLESELADPPTIADAARRLGVHPSHLGRAFTKAMGVPPHRYVLLRRVDRARRLLLAGVPIAEAATRSGFYDQAHLTRNFVRVLGTTPSIFARSGRDAA